LMTISFFFLFYLFLSTIHHPLPFALPLRILISLGLKSSVLGSGTFLVFSERGMMILIFFFLSFFPYLLVFFPFLPSGLDLVV
jgi:hypothetical protein